jgi:hypothetical protein
LAYLLNLLAVDATEELEFSADGTEKRVKLPVTRELKIDICKTLAVFFYPRLNSTAVSGPDNGPIEVARADADLERIMADPSLVEAAQALSLAMSAASVRDAAPAQLAPPGESTAQPARDAMETLERDPITGHWSK